VTEPIPAGPGQPREDWIVRAVREGRSDWAWDTVESRHGGRVCAFGVMRDALRIDGVRVSVTATTAQRIADLLGAMLPTPKMATLTWLTATKLDPQPRPISASTEAMIAHSHAVDAAIAGRAGLVADVGKWWVLTDRLTESVAANFGWHVRTDPWRGIHTERAVSGDAYVIQGVGHRHDPRHVDYSQVCRLVDARCTLDGRDVSVRSVLESPDWPLLDYGGPLGVFRQPGVPLPEQSILVLPPTVVEASRRDEPDTDPAPAAVPFLQARNYTPGPRTEVKWLVIHTAETGEVKHAARNLMQWCAGPSAPRASWHYAIDAEQTTQSVREVDIAWHAPGANRYGIGIEHAGRAAQTAAEWADEYSGAVLARSARLVADLCARWRIPFERIGPTELRAGTPGICGHVDVSRAWRKSTHTDPGTHFPWGRYLDLIRSAS